MPINYINTGSSPNKGDGDTLRTAFNKINENFSTLVQEIGSTSSYVLPTASTSTLGGIKVGANLTITNGVLSATAVPATPFTGTVAVLTATQSINLNGIVLSNSSGTLSAITITGTATEPYVELLLHADDFTEDSTNSVPILSNGVTVNTSQKRFGVGSFYFDGSSYISLPGSASNPAFDQAGDITIEFWTYVDTFNVGNIICSEALSGSHWAIENAGDKLYFQCNDGTTSFEIIPTTLLPVSQWTHCAVVKSGTNVTIYQNGGSIGSVNIGSSTAFNDTVYDIAVGSISNGSFGFFQGYLDEVRISRGIALYTGAFTPPTAPFPGDTIIIASALPPSGSTFTVTNISYFTNDKNYITATDVTSLGYVTATYVTSQGYLTSGTVNQYVNSFTVTNVSYFTNDAGYLTATDVTLLADTLDSVLARSSSTVQTITAGNIVPSADKQYDLGTPTNQWRSLYVGTATIYIDNIALSINTANNTVVVGPTSGQSILATQDYVTVAISGIPAGPKGDQGLIGNTGTQGVQGPIGNTGAQGINIVLVGSSATTTVETLGAGSAGQGWINTGDGDVYFWNTLTTQWENIGPIVGPEGPRGPQGNDGPQGIQGIQGNTGTQGTLGPTGPKGDRGDIGLTGSTGTQGSVGPTGATGTAATVTIGTVSVSTTTATVTNVGTTGSAILDFVLQQGPQGVPGADGNDGAPGAAGNDGAPGADALWNFTGAYGGGTSYATGDVATYEGETWYRLNANGGNTGDTPTEGTFWTKIAEKGADGAAGSDTYTPTTPTDWLGSPTVGTITAGLDELAGRMVSVEGSAFTSTAVLVNGEATVSLETDGRLTLAGDVQFLNQVIQASNGTVTCLGNASAVVYTSSDQYRHTIKLLIQVEGSVPGEQYETQSCEMIIAKSFRGNDIASSVYGVVHTSAAPLATFTAEWNALTNRVDVVCTASSEIDVYVRTFATEITTSD